jgi:hypothetical protein
MPGHNNWFKINLELGLNNLELPFEMELSVPPTLTTDFKQASDEAAKLLASKFNKLYLNAVLIFSQSKSFKNLLNVYLSMITHSSPYKLCSSFEKINLLSKKEI